MSLSQQDHESIAQKTAAIMLDRSRGQWIDPDTHTAHHEWVEQKLTEEEEWREFRKKVIQSSIVWAIPLVLFFIGNTFWKELKHLVTQ